MSQNLNTCNPKPTYCFLKSARIICGVEISIKFKQLANLRQVERRLGVSKPPQYSFNSIIDVCNSGIF